MVMWLPVGARGKKFNGIRVLFVSNKIIFKKDFFLVQSNTAFFSFSSHLFSFYSDYHFICYAICMQVICLDVCAVFVNCQRIASIPAGQYFKGWHRAIKNQLLHLLDWYLIAYLKTSLIIQMTEWYSINKRILFVTTVLHWTIVH